MDALMYDKAMLARWKSYFKNTFWVRIGKEGNLEATEEMLSEVGCDLKDVSQYPLLALQRIGIPVGLKENNLSAVSRGARIAAEEHYLTFAKFLLRYQLDIYSADRENFDQLVIEIQENLIRYPFLKMKTEDRFFGEQTFTIDVEDIQDLSDVESFKEKAPIYRASVIYTIDSLIQRRFKALRVEEFIIEVKEVKP